ncbi:MAG: O-antigen ligase family protein, partial [Patescibacteria group bacterium]
MPVLFFVVLLFTRSRSGLVGFAVADIAFWGLMFWKTRDFARIRLPFVICHVSFVIVVFLNGTSIDSIDRWFRPLSPSPATSEATPSGYAAPLLEYGGTESGTIRKYVWQGAIAAWASTTKTRLIGTGTETFAFAFYQYRPREHNLTSEWDFLYNKAHNEYLNYLTTTGLFGLGSYLLIIGVFIVWYLKRISEPNTFVSFALFAGWVSILVTNFFGFSVVILQLFFFLFPAMVLVNMQSTSAYYTRPFRVPRFTVWVVSVACLVLLVMLIRMWWADFLFAKGYRGARLGQYQQALQSLTSAIAMNPTEPLYHDEAASALSLLVSVAIANRDATTAASLARESIKENDRAIGISPANVNYWKTRTKILYSFAPFDPTFTKAAITALEKARELSPKDPKIPYNLAVLYGQNGESQKAIELLKAAVDLKPNYRDAYWALHIFYKETGSPELAKSVLS